MRVLFTILSGPCVALGLTFSPGAHAENCVYQPALSIHAREAVLILAGYGGKAAMYESAAELLGRNGIASYRCDFSNTAAEQDRSALQDVEVVLKEYKRLVELSGASHIGIVGTSIGALAAILVSEKVPVAWMALHAPALYPDKQLSVPISSVLGNREVYAQLREWRKQSLNWRDSQVLRALHHFGGPVLMAKSGEDHNVPPKSIVNSMKAARSAPTLVVIEKATHDLSPQQLDYLFDAILEWMPRTKD